MTEIDDYEERVCDVMEEIFMYIDKVYDMAKGYDKYELDEIANRLLYIRSRLSILQDKMVNGNKIVECFGFSEDKK